MAERALDAQRVADAVGTGMYANDRASRALGMQVTAIGPGTATLTMTVRDDMLNGFDICHGGFITLLADSAFAFACNSRNALTVAAGLDIEFIASAHGGDVLTAQAGEVHLAGRNGLYDIVVCNQRGERIAMVRGRSHRLKDREVVPLADACFAPEPLPTR
ncbi:MAG TPA: hydroxyphenylacetyl-CoA thioesterase PaaI [Burkholderiaceae bacterium]|nr:hydroxyphenylacetyl-CoA thioesterase PaaI [Burkholderiaceae bacterium]